MNTLDKKKLKKLLLSMAEVPLDKNLPAEMAPEDVILMKRCMEATSMEEIADISTDKILDLFNFIGAYGEFVMKLPCLGNSTEFFLDSLQAVPSAVRRRIF